MFIWKAHNYQLKKSLIDGKNSLRFEPINQYVEIDSFFLNYQQ